MNFWEKRWLNGQTGWHNAEVNANLVKHSSTVFTKDNPSILVPLCGKSMDMQWLQEQGANITGVDLARQALHEYFEDRNQEFTEGSQSGLTYYSSTNPISDSLQLFHANIFDVRPNAFKAFDAIYDRAALVALLPEQREQYAQHCLSLLKPGGTILLITYDSPVEDDQGPPFPVRPGTIQRLFQEASECEQIDEVHMTKDTNERLQKRGLDWSRSDIWKITK